MTRPREFPTSDLDLAAAIMTATGRQPAICRHPGRDLVTFEYKDDEAVRTIVLSYAGCELAQPVKRFAACRAWLYRQAKSTVSSCPAALVKQREDAE